MLGGGVGKLHILPVGVNDPNSGEPRGFDAPCLQVNVTALWSYLKKKVILVMVGSILEGIPKMAPIWLNFVKQMQKLHALLQMLSSLPWSPKVVLTVPLS